MRLESGGDVLRITVGQEHRSTNGSCQKFEVAVHSMHDASRTLKTATVSNQRIQQPLCVTKARLTGNLHKGGAKLEMRSDSYVVL